MNTLVSIIVPIYNSEQYLDKCIKSILNQTYKYIELILVDDGSVDDSYKICSKYKAADSRIKLIIKTNGGLVSARKAGIKAACGEYVGYVDADDWIECDFVENLLNYIVNSNADVVESNLIIDMDSDSEKKLPGFDEGLYSASEIRKEMLCDNNLCECRLGPSLCTKLFKRNMLIDVQLDVDERIDLGEDAAVTYTFLLNCNSIYISDYSGYHYVQRASSISYENTQEKKVRLPYVIPYLQEIFEAYSGNDREQMLWQLEQYKKLIYLEYCPEEYDKDYFLSAFGGVPLNCKLVIYGAGRLGKSIYNYVRKEQGVELLHWVDRNWKQFTKLGYDVESPESLHSYRNSDVVFLIAIFKKSTVEGVKDYLCSMGIDREKILSVH